MVFPWPDHISLSSFTQKSFCDLRIVSIYREQKLYCFVQSYVRWRILFCFLLFRSKYDRSCWKDWKVLFWLAQKICICTIESTFSLIENWAKPKSFQVKCNKQHVPESQIITNYSSFLIKELSPHKLDTSPFHLHTLTNTDTPNDRKWIANFHFSSINIISLDYK